MILGTKHFSCPLEPKDPSSEAGQSVDISTLSSKVGLFAYRLHATRFCRVSAMPRVSGSAGDWSRRWPSRLIALTTNERAPAGFLSQVLAKLLDRPCSAYLKTPAQTPIGRGGLQGNLPTVIMRLKRTPKGSQMTSSSKVGVGVLLTNSTLAMAVPAFVNWLSCSSLSAPAGNCVPSGR